MPIDLIAKYDANEKKILQYVNDRISTYFSSTCFKKLRNRYDSLSDSIDMRFHTGRNKSDSKNDWFSKISIPLVRERMLLRRAVTKHNFRADPLITLTPTGSTPIENAQNAQEILAANFLSTQFRRDAFRKIVDSCSRYGTSVVYSQWCPTVKTAPKTIWGEMGRERIERTNYKRNVINKPTHILNYFQNPHIADASQSDFQGHIERRFLSELITEFKASQANDGGGWIKEGLEKAIKEAKEGSVKHENFHTRNGDEDYKAIGVDVAYWYGHINISGNEEDDTEYCLDVIGDNIIRFRVNEYDDYIRPYSIINFDPREEYWWANVDSENVKPHESYINMLVNMKADNAIRNMEQYVFYNKTMLDPAAINNRHKSGGWIPVDLKNAQSLKDMLMRDQGRDISGQDTDWIIREVKESAQRMTPNPDLQRSSQEGGLQNKTLGAAQMIQQKGDVLESDLLESFGDGLCIMAEKNVTILQQFLSDVFKVRPDIKQPEKMLHIRDILGNYGYRAESSLSKTKIGETARLQNAITGIMNFKGTGDPSFQNINMAKIIRDWIKGLDVGDIDEIYPEQPAMQQMPGYMQSAQPGMAEMAMQGPGAGVPMQTSMETFDRNAA